tara:strand:- start:203 stop:928 length:726 start_codon:yes stop_codon:yes gene_type:complete
MKNSLRPSNKGNFHSTGSTNSILPIALAFGFFSLFVTISLWFLFTKNRDSRANISSSQLQQSPSSQPLNAPNPFQKSNNLPNVLKPPPPPPTIPSTSNNSAFSNNKPKQLTESEASDLVQSWLAYKKNLFAEPFDISQLDQFLIKPGKLYSDITKQGGSIDWLKQRKSYYIFDKVKLEKIIEFESFQDTAHLTADIFEDIKLMTPTGIDSTQSGQKRRAWIYDLKKNKNGEWKIYDYRRTK